MFIDRYQYLSTSVNYTLFSGCFLYAKDSRNFGRNSNGKVRFSFFRPEYSGSPQQVVHILAGIFCLKFAIPFSTKRFFALIREFEKGMKSGKSHSYWLARFNRKMSFHCPWVFLLISDWSVWHNGKHPLIMCPGIINPYIDLLYVLGSKAILSKWFQAF